MSTVSQERYELAYNVLMEEKSWLPSGPIEAIRLLSVAYEMDLDITERYIQLCEDERNVMGVSALICAISVLYPEKIAKWLEDVTFAARKPGKHMGQMKAINLSYPLGAALAMFRIHLLDDRQLPDRPGNLDTMTMGYLRQILLFSISTPSKFYEIGPTSFVDEHAKNLYSSSLSNAVKLFIRQAADQSAFRARYRVCRSLLEKISDEFSGYIDHGPDDVSDWFRPRANPNFLVRSIIDELSYALIQSLSTFEKAWFLGHGPEPEYNVPPLTKRRSFTREKW